MKVALVVMPFAAAHRPSLGVGLLQAGLRRHHIDCDAKYLNVMLSRLLPTHAWQFLSGGSNMTALAGEWAFSQVFYGQGFSSWETYQRDVLDDPVWGMGDAERHAILELLEVAPLFLQLGFESARWDDYDLVGFTSTFEQTMPSLCLARMIREAHPNVLIALGGANFESDMAAPYLEYFDFIDFVSTREADVSFPQLCASLRAVKEGAAAQLVVPDGIRYRHGSGMATIAGPTCGPVVMDDLPVPDYDDFFLEARGSASCPPHSDSWPEWLPIEASRGCWWGQKAHCTFCGLNGEAMTFRRKSWRRVVDEIAQLVSAYGCTHLQFTDNILGMDYFQDLLPFWANSGDPTLKYFEVKSNLRRSQLEVLSRAGVTLIQPGIESLSDETLRLMRKGVSAAQNLAFMRWCAELGITALWNIIFAFPGEPIDDYPAMLALLRRITHLPPPSVISPIRMDRFSPNHSLWKEFGFTKIAPLPAYRHVFPFDARALEQLAYYFSYEHDQFDASMEAATDLQDFGREWRAQYEAGRTSELAVQVSGRGFALIDTRFNVDPSRRDLTAEELQLLLACDAPIRRESGLHRASAVLAGRGREHSPELLDACLSQLIERGEIVEVSGLLVNVVVLPTSVRERAHAKEGASDGEFSEVRNHRESRGGIGAQGGAT